MRSVLRRQNEDEEESAFISMTDMTVSFLFIVMILLAFFASQLQDKEKVSRSIYDQVVNERNELRDEVEKLRRRIAEISTEVSDLKLQIQVRDERIRELEALLKELQERPIETYLRQVADQRLRILKELEAKLRVDFPDLQIEINREKDALRFKGDGLFQTNLSKLASDKRLIVEKIALRLNEVLPCYTVGRKSLWKRECNEAGAVIEAVQIEGHTDSDGPDIRNLVLSTERANETFIVMTQREPTLVEYLNNRLQPVLSVAGYGKMRPVADNKTSEGKATNRRIDLRIIMYTPQSIEDIQKVRQELQRGIGLGAPQ